MDSLGFAPWWAGLAGKALKGGGGVAVLVGIAAGGNLPAIAGGVAAIGIGFALEAWSDYDSAMGHINNAKEIANKLEEEMKLSEEAIKNCN